MSKKYRVDLAGMRVVQIAELKAPHNRPDDFEGQNDLWCKNVDDWGRYSAYMESFKPATYPLQSVPESWVQDMVITDEDFEIYYRCPACGGDGKETCNNPDHGFIEAMPGETGRLGCPVCGHDPKHKVNRGKNTCPECGGHGHVLPAFFEEYGRETGYDEDPVPIAIPILQRGITIATAADKGKEREANFVYTHPDSHLVQIWNYDPRKPNADPQVVFIERDKVEKLFEMLREANEEFYNKQPPVRTNLPGDPPAGKKQRPDVF